MLSKKIYEFEKFKEDVKNVYTVYGDNLEESIQVITWLCEFNKDKIILEDIKYKSLSEYVYILKINEERYYFIAKSYYRNGEIPTKVRELIKELDKPDVVIFDNDNVKVVFGIEVTHTTFAGNATWQRTGRIIRFLEKNIPFAFIGYFSKQDKSQGNRKARKPSLLFVLMYIMLSLKYSTPALIGFFKHPDKKQNLEEFNKFSDWRKSIFKYILSEITKSSDYNSLKECYKNMRSYYINEDSKVLNDEFGPNTLKYLRNEKFEENIIKDIKNKNNVFLFYKDELHFNWNPKKITKYINEKFKGVKFYQLSKNCKAGISFETQKIIKLLNENSKEYIEDYIEDENAPIVIIPIKLTKNSKKQNGRIPTDDPYNGEISAFSNIYLQSFKNAKIILLLCDHSNNNEYSVEAQKNRKIYKSINKYADLVIDLDFNKFDRISEKTKAEHKSKYENKFTTEDDVTSFFGTILTLEGIEPSFINPPCGSWSDIKLLPTNEYYYYNRNDERGDIAYFNEYEEVYYVGESKKNYNSLKKDMDKEVQKTKKLGNIILKELGNKYKMKLFAIFKGKKEEAIAILDKSELDNVVIVNDESDDKVTLEVFEK